MEAAHMLILVKLLHTLVWAFLAGSILALPLLAVGRRFRLAWILSGIVLLECAVLGTNSGRCPLTDVAARFTSERGPSFVIYLPGWLAEHNKLVFGLLFLAGELILSAFWVREKHAGKGFNH
jgi:hypothetical protein